MPRHGSCKGTGMIDPASTPQAHYPPANRPKPVLTMIQNDRMAGSVPAWVVPDSVQNQTLARLDADKPDSFQSDLNALNYQTSGPERNINNEPFGFGDLIDIINPLQHIPVVSMIYREVTGDQIRPSSNIVGGALYGGAAGAASGLVNLIIEEETGRSVEGHVMATLFPEPGATEETLTRLAATDAPVTLPGTVMAFADLGYADENPVKTPKVSYTYKFNE